MTACVFVCICVCVRVHIHVCAYVGCAHACWYVCITVCLTACLAVCSSDTVARPANRETGQSTRSSAGSGATSSSWNDPRTDRATIPTHHPLHHLPSHHPCSLHRSCHLYPVKYWSWMSAFVGLSLKQFWQLGGVARLMWYDCAVLCSAVLPSFTVCRIPYLLCKICCEWVTAPCWIESNGVNMATRAMDCIYRTFEAYLLMMHWRTWDAIVAPYTRS